MKQCDEWISTSERLPHAEAYKEAANILANAISE